MFAFLLLVYGFNNEAIVVEFLLQFHYYYLDSLTQHDKIHDWIRIDVLIKHHDGSLQHKINAE